MIHPISKNCACLKLDELFWKIWIITSYDNATFHQDFLEGGVDKQYLKLTVEKKIVGYKVWRTKANVCINKNIMRVMQKMGIYWFANIVTKNVCN